MKKALLITASFFIAAKVYGFQGEGTLPTYPIKLQLSSITATPDTNVLLASGPINLNMVAIGSPTVNNAGASFIQFYGSTSPIFGSWVTSITPKISLDSSPGNPVKDTTWNIFSSSYTFYDKKGSAEIGIIYDWISSVTANPRRLFNKYPKP